MSKSYKTIRPGKQGLYDPSNEHDACGIGFVANIKGTISHSIVDNGLEMLENLEHRGAVGADKSVGDGAGILSRIPDEFFRNEFNKKKVSLPDFRNYGVGMFFLPKNKKSHIFCKNLIHKIISQNNLIIFHSRKVPVRSNILSDTMKSSEPVILQFFIKGKKTFSDNKVFERKLFVTGKLITNSIAKKISEDKNLSNFTIASISSRTINYKGMLLSNLVRKYFVDLSDPLFKSNFSLIHQRFSTNTFPSWDLAQPFKMICHNGEINTVRGNVNWINARKATLESKVLKNDLRKIWPLINYGQSDSACFDNALELLIMGGYDLAHAMMILIPEAWQNSKNMNDMKKAFYQYYSMFSEPWDGPAAVAFTDGNQIGATLDRNGLRPARYFLTTDDRLVLSSEMGVLRVPEDKIIEKFRLRPGKMLLVDLNKGKIINDALLKKEMYSKCNFEKKLSEDVIKLDKYKTKKRTNKNRLENLQKYHNFFGYTEEDLKILMTPMVANSAEAIGSMGTDTPVAVLSEKPKLLFNYFKQNFAQVTNPAIDPIREETVMSLISYLGPRANLLNLEIDEEKRILLEQPVLTSEMMYKVEDCSKKYPKSFKTNRFSILFRKDKKLKNIKENLLDLCKKVEYSVKNKNCRIVILSDIGVRTKLVPYPSLLALSSVHHHLIKKGLRTKCSIIVETAEAREVHHFCLLGGYGAEAIFPYLALETLSKLNERNKKPSIQTKKLKEKSYVKAIGKGILKVMSKMGISTFQSYNGAQIFDAVGLSTKFVDGFFSGTKSLIEGVGFNEIIMETINRHEEALKIIKKGVNRLNVGGEYSYRLKGEKHVWTPLSISSLQHSVRKDDKNKYLEYSNLINNNKNGILNPRSLFKIKKSRKSIDIEQVESAQEIVKRFSTGAMSFGSISREAHTTLANAMNKIGGRSNTGEGGEERDRFTIKKDGSNLKSAIKQVASGRFGVTTEYLVNSTDIQIKISQGAKPGEGGQLPGHKVDKVIADVRFSTPGVGLISPPPHHDIYSIEDLAQLIFDLKNVNPKARISVKLVSEIGVGTVAAGVAKAKADHITISGFEGGTGASPLTSIKHAGSPWEIGLAETQQTLVLNRLRSRIALQVDGGLRTGRDVVIGALLGADEFGFSTAPLIAIGCIMMRKCHLNTCPVGIATQNPVLRKKFQGKPDHVIKFFFHIAEEIRQLLSEMGFKKLDDIIGRTDLLSLDKERNFWKTKGLDFRNVFYAPLIKNKKELYNTDKQYHNLSKVLDKKFISEFKRKFKNNNKVFMKYKINNTDRSVGAMFSGSLALVHRHEGLKEDTVTIDLKGTAGQSFGAFTTYGVTFNLRGEGNDYVGKGLCGGKIIISPPKESKVCPEESIIVGNTVLYGAIAGECYFRGIAGERFAVRNSGAWAVIEGLGDHGCEYMTGGVVVCLGTTGKNFGAGMSGGISYIYDSKNNFSESCNMSLIDIEDFNPDLLNTKFRVSDSLLKSDMLRYHKERLHYLISRHFNYTNSEKASLILKDWIKQVKKFKIVFPKDYKKALLNLDKDANLKVRRIRG